MRNKQKICATEYPSQVKYDEK